MIHQRIVAIAVIGLAIFGTVPALAAESAENLYKQGMEQLNQNKYQIACPLFAESFRLDSKPGTLFALALCESEAGHVATGRAYYEWFLRLYNDLSEQEKRANQKRKKIASEQVELLAKDVPTLKLTLPAERPRGTRVFLDGKEVESIALEKPISVDPGERMVRVEVPGRKAWTDIVNVTQKGEKKEVHLQIPDPTDPPDSVTEDVQAKKPGPVNGRRTAAIVVGGVGIVGLVMYGVTGGLTLSRKQAFEKQCVIATCSAQTRAAMLDNGRMFGNLATVGLGVGFAGVATGAVLWFTAPKHKDASVPRAAAQFDVLGIGPEGALFGLRGTF